MRAGKIPDPDRTRNAAMDSLVSRYALILARHDRLRGLGWDMLELRAAKPLNTIALADRFAHAAPVVSAAPDSWIGGGDDIAATRVAGGWRLDYSVRWGALSGWLHLRPRLELRRERRGRLQLRRRARSGAAGPVGSTVVARPGRAHGRPQLSPNRAAVPRISSPA